MEDRVIFGHLVKAASEDDGLPEFVLSDDSTDRMGDIINIDGWVLSKFKSNPIALYGHNQRDLPIGRWEKVRIEGNKLLGRLRLAEEGTSPFIDALRSLLRQGILRAVSVGFKPIKYEPIDEKDPWGPLRFLKQELLECSVVAVPANANALAIRNFSSEVRQQLIAASGTVGQQRTKELSAAASGNLTRGPNKMSLSERIQAAQNELIALNDLQAPLLKKVKDDEELTEEEQAEFDRIETERGPIEKKIGTLRAAEKQLGITAVQRGDQNQNQQIHSPAVITDPTVMRQALKAGSGKDRPADLLVRLAVCHFKSFVDRRPLLDVQRETYGDRTEVEAVIKAVTNPALTTVAGWAAELVSTATADYIESLKADSVFANLAPRGASFSFGRDGAIKIPRRNRPTNAPGDLRAAFVGEGQPIPVRRGSFGSATLLPHKMGVISTFSREIAKHSTPQIEALIREGINEDTAMGIDQALLDAIAADAIRPAGLGNGVTPIAGSALGGADAVVADISAAMGPFITANAASGLVFLINPGNLLTLQFTTNALGAFVFRDQVNAGNLGGVSFIASTNVPATKLYLVRASDFASATSEVPEFDISDVATIHEEDGGYPADQAMRPGTSTVLPINAGTPAVPVRSLWQTATIGIRMILDMDWVMRRAGMVSIVDNIDWTTPVTP